MNTVFKTLNYLVVLVLQAVEAGVSWLWMLHGSTSYINSEPDATLSLFSVFKLKISCIRKSILKCYHSLRNYFCEIQSIVYQFI